ncbi:MAG: hypothetical protein ACLGPM_01055 [Acidobacteriota bacterium]
MKHNGRWSRIGLLLLLTGLGFVVMGYHPGLEDDGIYLAAVKADLHPALYPYNSAFFRLQVQATIFDGTIANFVRATHVPVAWAELLWQLLSIFVVLWACHRIAGKLFADSRAQWAAVALVSAMLTLPVSGTALYLMDQHLHPRNIATALILMAVDRVLEGRRLQAAALLVPAFLMHPIMAAMGISFCVFLGAALSETVPVRLRALRSETAAALPLGWILEPPNPVWKKALDTRTYYYLYKWTWYEWLGALAPLAMFWGLWRWARRRNETVLARFALAVFAYGVFQQALAMVMLTPPEWIRLTPLQPMRYLQLVYFFMVLIAGGLLGRFALRGKAWRWAVFLLAANGGMLWSQCAQYPASQHIEWPGRKPENAWLQAFAWIRSNTPADAYFALDPYYLRAPGEDYHGFRALAERSQLADAIKDAAAVTQVPELGETWDQQVTAEQGWRRFGLADFERLKREFGVDWVVVARGQTAGLDCRWHDQSLAVCRIP